MNKTQRDGLTKFLTARIDTARAVMEEFSGQFNANPSFALEWGDHTFQHAARLSPSIAMLKRIETDEELTLEAFIAYLSRQVTQKAQYPSRSTSACTNLMAQYNLAAWAEILEMAESYVGQS